MDLATASVLVAAIGFAGKIITYIGSLPNVRTVLTGQREEVTNAERRELNKRFLEEVINQTSQHFSTALENMTFTIIDEIRKRDVEGTIQLVWANARSLNKLMDIHTEHQNLNIELVISAINPLQVSIETARIKLQTYGEEDIWLFCHIVGMGALIAGYAFIGMDMPVLRTELEKILKEVQMKMLDEVAFRLIPKKSRFPWEQVPLLLSVEGVNDLLELYKANVVPYSDEIAIGSPSGDKKEKEAVPKIQYSDLLEQITVDMRQYVRKMFRG